MFHSAQMISCYSCLAKICSPYLTNTTILQVEGGVDAASVAGSHPGMEQKEEPYDPMNIPDVDK